MATEAQIKEIIKIIEAQAEQVKSAKANAAGRSIMLNGIATVANVAVEPPGRPNRLDDLAGPFTKLGGQVEALVDNVERIARKRLPELWESSAGLSAREVVSATGKLMDRTQPAMRMAASALREYSDDVRKLRRQHEEGYDRLKELYERLATATSVKALEGMAPRVVRALNQLEQIYRGSLEAAEKLIKDLKEVQRRAVAQRFEEMGAANAVLLATATKGGKFKTILTEDEAKKAADLRKNLSPEENARLSAMLSAAPTPEHQAYLLKALASGYNLDSVGRFAEQIKDKSPEWLANQPNLITPVAKPGNNNDNSNNNPNATDQNANDPNQQNQQPGQTPGGGATDPASSQPGGSPPSGQDPTGQNGTNTGQNGNTDGNTGNSGNTSDPSQKPADNSPDDNSPGGISAKANPYWADMATESPEGMADGLNKHSSELGATYGAREVDRSDNDAVKTALKDSVDAVDKGHSVPVRIGEGDSQKWLLLIGRDGDELIFDHPDGKVVRVKEDDFVNGCMGEDRKSAVSSVVLPKTTSPAAASA